MPCSLLLVLFLRLIALSDIPQWAQSAVWYQIFPTRFRNGDSSNDLSGTVLWTQAWDKLGPGESEPLIKAQINRRYGGDIEGLRQSLPYLRELGVTALYLNPVFQALTEHKYDTCDYRHIDDSLGVKDSRLKLVGERIDDPKTWQWSESDKLFLKFLNEAHAMGFKVVIDGVFNHVGPEFEPWQDVLKSGKSSKYSNWFEILDWGPPLRWKSWNGENGNLIFIHKTPDGMNSEYEKFLFAIVQRWMDPNQDGDPVDGVDGWRLDAPQYVPHGFWKRFWKHVKKLNPNALLVGEIWTDPSDWLDRSEFDVVTNYRFAYDVFKALVTTQPHISISQLWDHQKELFKRFPRDVSLSMWNLLDSHDTDRVASMVVNPDREYNQNNNPHQQSSDLYLTRRPTAQEYDRLKLALVFQFTWPGAPMIYYGTETGMFGARDPHCRKPMLWADQPVNDDLQERLETAIFMWLKKLAAIRNTFSCVRTSAPEIIVLEDTQRILGYRLSDSFHTVDVYFNLSDKLFERNITLPAFVKGLAELLSEGDIEIINSSGPFSRPQVSVKQGVVIERNSAHPWRLVLPARQAKVFLWLTF